MSNKENLEKEEELKTKPEGEENRQTDPKTDEGQDDQAEYYRAQVEKYRGGLLSEREKRKAIEAELERLKEQSKAKGEEPEDEPELDSKLQEWRKKDLLDYRDELIEEMASSVDEAEAIKVQFDRIYRNEDSKRAVKELLSDAALLANKDRVLADAEKRARKGVAERHALGMANTRARSSRDRETKTINEAIPKAVGMDPARYAELKEKYPHVDF